MLKVFSVFLACDQFRLCALKGYAGGRRWQVKCWNFVPILWFSHEQKRASRLFFVCYGKMFAFFWCPLSLATATVVAAAYRQRSSANDLTKNLFFVWFRERRSAPLRNWFENTSRVIECDYQCRARPDWIVLRNKLLFEHLLFRWFGCRFSRFFHFAFFLCFGSLSVIFPSHILMGIGDRRSKRRCQCLVYFDKA